MPSGESLMASSFLGGVSTIEWESTLCIKWGWGTYPLCFEHVSGCYIILILVE